ncbi:tyrosine-type recombinase/integrase [Sphingobacterium thalpophilum]|uniref:tyrosine-type recombinase/integrase n=1 Tax=Sphingobacterium thalpophilum TaxID=259 RepID=UPI0024A655A1|nr:tyrosine-type recombinase/integrase [Sphingobacterium thalpophilum]
MAIPKIYFKKKKNERDGQLYLYYSFSGTRLEYYTGFRIEEKYYNNQYFKNNQKKPIKNNYGFAAQINDTLDEMMTFCMTQVNTNKVRSKDILRALLDEEFKDKIKVPDNEANTDVQHDLISYFELVIKERRDGTRVIIKGPRKGQRYKESSIKNQDTTLYNLKRYIQINKLENIPFKEVNLNFYNKFKKMCFEDLGMTTSTFATRIRDIKAIMNEAGEFFVTEEIGHKSSRFIKPDYESDTVAVSMQDIEKLHNHDFVGKFNRVKDLFLIGCYSGMRFEDFSNFEILSLDDRFLRMKQNKTEERVTIPIMKKLREILKKYDNNWPKPVSNQEFNRTIKEIFKSKALNIDREIIIKVEGVQKKVKLSSMIGSHTGRRSYATNMFMLGVPNLLIMTATGHKTEKSFLKYIRATNEDKARLLAEWMDKLGI